MDVREPGGGKRAKLLSDPVEKSFETAEPSPPPAVGEPAGHEPRAVHFIVQSLVAAALVAGVLLVLHTVAGLVVVAALGSTAFLVFARPKSVEARPRNAVGGHALSIAAGAACGLAATYLLPGSALAGVLMGSLAVGISVLVMSVTDTEHAPATGVALAMAFFHEDMAEIAAAAAAGCVVVCVAGRLLRPWLRDLT